MSKLYGTINGSGKTQATRRGHSTLTTHAASWNGAIRVDIWIDDAGKEHYIVSRVPWKGTGEHRVIEEGTLN